MTLTYTQKCATLCNKLQVVDPYATTSLCDTLGDMGWPRLVGSLKVKVSNAKEPYKRDDILQKRPIILRSLLIKATPYDSVVSVLNKMQQAPSLRRIATRVPV